MKVNSTLFRASRVAVLSVTAALTSLPPRTAAAEGIAMLKGVFLFLSASIITTAQAPSGPYAFEVASVQRLAVDARPGGAIKGGPGSADPTLIRYGGLSMRDLLRYAYGVKNYQIFGPGWLPAERYDITARVAVGATQEQVRLMLRNLLGERFRLAVHHENRTVQVYELGIARRGLKIQRQRPITAGTQLSDKSPLEEGVTFDRNGLPIFPAGRPNLVSMMFNGHVHVMARYEPISKLVEMLGNQLQSPLLDKTGLDGNYDFTLDFMPGDPFGPPQGASATEYPTSSPAGPADGPSPAAPSLLTALEEQLGLTLEERRRPLDAIVVDRIEKTPTAN